MIENYSLYIFILKFELKYIVNKYSKMRFANIIIQEFIEHIKDSNNVDDILNSCEAQSEKGFIFERLFDIVIKFGFCDRFSNSEFIHIIGNVNNAKIKVLKTFDSYLKKKVISSKSSGCADLTLQNRDDGTYIFISSKYFENNEQKSVDDFDIQNIIAIISKNKDIYKNYKIYLLVSDKNSVIKKFNEADESSEYITEHINEDNILDKEDLNKYFNNFKKNLSPNPRDWDDLYLSEKKFLTLRFHQELIVKKTARLISKGNRSFLWGCKPRSGKTYMLAGIILDRVKAESRHDHAKAESRHDHAKAEPINVLIITPAPSETITQFTEDMFYKFRDFADFNIINIDGSKKLLNLDKKIGEKNIFITSKQLLQKYVGKKTINSIKDLKLDIIAFDENHFSGTTHLAKNILESYESKNTVKIYLTATYFKPLREWNIDENCQFFWDIEDEQICQKIYEDEKYLDDLEERHDKKIVSKIINTFVEKNYSIKDIFKCYLKMPQLVMLTNMFDQERYEILKERLKISNNKIGFCFDTLFGLNEEKNRFMFEQDIKIFLRYISGSRREEDGEKTIFTRINNICAKENTRYPFTQIWFLPSNNIGEISECLKKIMEKDKVLKEYDILCINGKSEDLKKKKAANIKDEITRAEKKAQNNGKAGLILLAGNMISLGITIELCDLVILFHNSLSMDRIFQQMYRCMTESNDKKYGFVVDLNISRVLNTCVNYVTSGLQSVDDKIKYIVQYHLINIDIDMMLNKEINADVVIEKLMEIWKEDPINNFRMLLKNLDNDFENFDNPTQKLLNQTFTKTFGNGKLKLDITLKDDGDKIQDLPSGKEIIYDEMRGDEAKGDETKGGNEVDEKKLCISFTKDVLPYVIPLTCVLTMRTSSMNFIKMLSEIKENRELLDIFDDQCQIWWNKKELIEIIKYIVNKYFDDRKSIQDITLQFKMSLQSLIDHPKELLELIADCLKPKDIEKKKFGEVFTPIHIINEMLDQLPTEVWQNKDLTWFDPAVGMGNFPIVIYLRLMEGLKEEIPDEKDRKKHIIENMLFMSELNKKNVFVCRQIFNINGEYKLNLNEGDTLKLKPLKRFGRKRFDIIVGNPPYNKGGIRSCTGKQLAKKEQGEKEQGEKEKEKNETIWPKFVERAMRWLKPGGFLLFINPLSWLKKSHSVHNLLLEKQILWLQLWNNSQAKKNINGVIPISLYVLHNHDNVDKCKTHIISKMRNNIETSSIEYLDKNYSIPLAYHSIFNKLMNFITINNLQLEIHTKTVKSTGKREKLPKIYELKDSFAIDTFTLNDGILVKKATEVHPDANKRKLIIANKTSLNGVFIDEGKLSLTSNHKFYILGNKLESLLNIFKFKIMYVIGHFTKYGQDFLDKDAFIYVPDIRKLHMDGVENLEELDFYKMIGLSNEEIDVFYKKGEDGQSDNGQSKKITVRLPPKKSSKNNLVSVQEEFDKLTLEKKD